MERGEKQSGHYYDYPSSLRHDLSLYMYTKWVDLEKNESHVQKKAFLRQSTAEKTGRHILCCPISVFAPRATSREKESIINLGERKSGKLELIYKLAEMHLNKKEILLF